LRDDRISLDLNLDLGSLFELHLAPLIVGQIIRDANFAIQMIRTLNGDLCFFAFSGIRMRGYNLFDYAWERGRCF